ncbi:MAG TPA: MoxR family ATPase [Ferruginibacter sp.]|nr:magnesium chelatase [Chitinophagaceae bacterium]HRI25650.1 MoxR family ATPase [Ferruginibacter sp.]
MEENLFQQRIDLSGLNRSVHEIRSEIGRVIVGQYSMVDLLLIGLLCDGHILIEGVPGVAKTLTAKLLARIIDVDFSRLQFTPDLMPSDVIGTSVFNPRDGEFRFKSGPVFSNIVLIDEINRAPAKTQAALFEVMEERQVTIDGHTHYMQAPFIVLATQNPIEQEGTYRLPEAQLDRFLFKIEVKYPTLEEEISILNGQQGKSQTQMLDEVRKVLSPVDIQHYRTQVQAIITEPKIVEFIARIVHETRNNPALYLGASPRASLALLRSAKASAAIRGRDFVTPEDVVEMAPHVLRHRIILTPEKEMEGVTEDDLIETILKSIEVPR